MSVSASDKEAIRARMPEILEHYGINSPIRNFKSPWRNDNDPSCCYYPDTNLIHDFGTGETLDAFGLIGKMEKVAGFPEQAIFAAQILNYSLDGKAAEKPPKKPSKPRFEIPAKGGFSNFNALERTQRAFSDLFEPCGKQARDWIHSRGFDDADIVRYCLGYVKAPRDFAACFTYRGTSSPICYVSIPFSEDETFSNVHYVKLRAVPDGKPKEIGPTGINPPLFHEYLLMRPLPAVYVAEGLLDAIAIEKLTGKPCVGLGGTEFCKRIGRVLNIVPPHMRPSKLILTPDNDEAGKHAADTMKADLKALHMPFSVLDMPKGCKDPNDVLMKETNL